MLIICGSATSWIVKNIIKNKGGLHNRITRRIYLRPFTVSECKQYLDYKNIIIGHKDILECYMVMGGVPYYLSLMQRGESLAQNVDQMFFLRHGKLYGEFDELYSSLFEESTAYIKVIEAIGKKNKGLTRKEIIEATGMSDGGTLTKILNDLDNCDFIRKYLSLNNKERNSIYQLTDFYSLSEIHQKIRHYRQGVLDVATRHKTPSTTLKQESMAKVFSLFYEILYAQFPLSSQ